MARLRHALIAVLAAGPLVLAPRAAGAQSCHVELPQELREPIWRLALRAESARFRSSQYEGYYEGLQFSGGVARGGLSIGAALSAYRIVRNGLPDRGLGDLLVYSRGTLLGADGDPAHGGLALAVTLPTGDPRADLGMGHAMLMPGAWASAQLKQLLASSQISYAKALPGKAAHHHHGGVGPLVAPMSSSELEATLALTLPLYPGAENLRLKAGVAGALPVFDEGAAARLDSLVGLLLGDRVKASLELHFPIAGEPSVHQLVLELSVGMR